MKKKILTEEEVIEIHNYLNGSIDKSSFMNIVKKYDLCYLTYGDKFITKFNYDSINKLDNSVYEEIYEPCDDIGVMITNLLSKFLEYDLEFEEGIIVDNLELIEIEYFEEGIIVDKLGEECESI